MTARRIAYAALVAALPATGAAADPGAGALRSANDGSHCIALYKPVCAVKHGVRFTYSNACYARRAGARVVSRQACGDVDRFLRDRR